MWKPIVLFACLFPAAAAADDERPGPPDREIRELEAAFNRAVLGGDTEFFARVYADDLTHVSQSGRLRSKAEWLEGRRQGESNYAKYETADLKVRLYGETAVATGVAEAAWTEDGEAESGRFRFTRVWARRDGRWQVVAFQSTAID